MATRSWAMVSVGAAVMWFGVAAAHASPGDQDVTELTGFISPSGNVGCYIDPERVRCDIAERDWSPPPRPADCPDFTGYGQGLTLAAGGGSGVVCAGDTALFGGEALEYGEAISAGSLRCESSPAGITCRDSVSGHGFSLSRERYDLF